MLAGHFVAQSLHVVAVFGIADLIKKGHETADQIALAAGCHAPSLIRILCTLASMGVFTRDAAGRFGLTPLGETLRSDVPGSLRDKALFEISQPIWSAGAHALTVFAGAALFRTSARNSALAISC